MSSKTRTRKKRTTKTGSTPALRPVDDQTTTASARTEAEDKLWEALRAHPTSTAPFLAGAADIGRSTAGKILAKWAKDGSVTRTPGIAQGGGRAADLWAITATHTTPANDTAPADAIREETSASNPDPAATPIYSAVPADSPSPDPEPTTEPADSGPAETTNTESRNTEPPSGEPGAAADPAPDASDPATTKPVLEPNVAEITPPATDSAATDHAETDHAETDRAANGGTATGGDTANDGTVNDGTAENGDTVGKQPRLAPGALEGQVEDFLRAHPDDEFGPAAIAKKLARSSGAVSNALDRLVAKGTAVQTQTSPKRYTLAKGERTAAAATS